VLRVIDPIHLTWIPQAPLRLGFNGLTLSLARSASAKRWLWRRGGLRRYQDYLRQPILGADLRVASYSFELKVHCCIGSDSFEFTLLGDLFGIEQDADSDGDVGSLDLDNANDPTLDLFDPEPLNRFVSN